MATSWDSRDVAAAYMNWATAPTHPGLGVRISVVVVIVAIAALVVLSRFPAAARERLGEQVRAAAVKRNRCQEELTRRLQEVLSRRAHGSQPAKALAQALTAIVVRGELAPDDALLDLLSAQCDAEALVGATTAEHCYRQASRDREKRQDGLAKRLERALTGQIQGVPRRPNLTNAQARDKAMSLAQQVGDGKLAPDAVNLRKLQCNRAATGVAEAGREERRHADGPERTAKCREALLQRLTRVFRTAGATAGGPVAWLSKQVADGTLLPDHALLGNLTATREAGKLAAAVADESRLRAGSGPDR